MAKGDASDMAGVPTGSGFWYGLVAGMRHATFGGSIVTHMTWIVLAGIGGVAVVTSSAFADPSVKKWGIIAVSGLAVAGLGTLIWTSVSPLANVLGKDIPDTLRAVQEKGRTVKADLGKLQSTPPAAAARRREKGNNV